MNNDHGTPEVKKDSDEDGAPPSLLGPYPPMEPHYVGRRYKRLTTSPHFTPYLNRRRKREGWVPGNVDEMEAVFKARSEYFAVNPSRENYEEIITDTADLRMVLSDFPNLWEFIGEFDAVCMEAHRRLIGLENRDDIITRTQQQLQSLLDQNQRGELEKEDLEARLQMVVSHLERSKENEAHSREQLEELKEAREAEERKSGVRVERVKSNKWLAQDIGISESWLSELINELRVEGVVKTKPGRRITLEEAKDVKKEANERERPERRQKSKLSTESHRI